ncbi:AGAMOUS-like 104 [Perilla frutescens var. frutescens]|nr:AGAMOUS-like 104 [Perilla frutescens var. frutescens]
MGRKIDMKKIEDVTKCQVTFSKRRSSLMKKANEIAICCDVDVAFVAFSPSGRSALLGHLQTSHAQPSFQMDQTVLKNQDGVEVSCNDFNVNELNLPAQSSTAEQILTKVVDPWISPFSGKFCESILEDSVDETNMKPAGASNLPISSTMCDISYSRVIPGPIITSHAQIPHQQPLVADHILLEQNPVNAWNNFSPVTFSNALYNSTNSLSTMPPPRLTPTIITSYGSDVKMAECDTIQSSSQYAISNFSQFTNSGGEETTQVNKMCTTHDHSEAQGTSGDNVFWTSKIQKSNLWEWDDMLLDENFNFGGFSK